MMWSHDFGKENHVFVCLLVLTIVMGLPLSGFA